MNIATGKLEAPIVKKAGLLDAQTLEGVLGTLKNLATSKGLLGASAPIDSYALSAGLGAGASEATNRLLKNKLKYNPKLRKALSDTMGYTAGGGAGLAASIASPLAPVISKGSGSQAARSLAELTAIGTGGELVASPFLNAALKSGNPDGAVKTLAKMVGGGSLAGAGVLARDKRNVDSYIQQYLAGKLPKGIPTPDLKNGPPSLLQLAKVRKNQFQKAIPQGGLLALGGAGLLASGSPILGASALLSAPMANKRLSRYIGDVSKELSSAKKTKDSLDNLYKKSSANTNRIKLAAPVYMTMPYCLDAPTMDKVAFGWLRNLGGEVLNFAARMTPQQKQIARQGAKVFNPARGPARQQGKKLLRSSIDARAVNKGSKPALNPEFVEQQKIIDEAMNLPFGLNLRRQAAKRRQAVTPMYQTTERQIGEATSELGATGGMDKATARLKDTTNAQNITRNAPGAQGATSQGQVFINPTTNPSVSGLGSVTPGAVDLSGLGAQKDYFKRLADLRRKSKVTVTHHSGTRRGTTSVVNRLNKAEQAELSQLEALETQFGGVGAAPHAGGTTPTSADFHEFVTNARTMQRNRQAVTARAGEMQQAGEGATDALTRAGGEGVVGQTVRKALRPSTYGNLGRGGSAANLEERLLRESGGVNTLEFLQGAEGSAGVLRQGTEATMRSAANRAGLGQTTAAMRNEANKQLKRLNLPANQQEQVMRAYEEHMVKNKGAFDGAMFQQELAKVTGVELGAAGKITSGRSQAIPRMTEITDALGNNALNKTRGNFGTAMGQYVSNVQAASGKNLARNQTKVLNTLESSAASTTKRFAKDPTATGRIANIESLSKEIEQLHTLHNSAEGRQILQVVNATLSNKTTTAEQLGQLQRNLQNYFNGKPTKFKLPAQRGMFGNNVTGKSARTFTADMNKASPELREAFKKKVEFGTGSASKARDAAFTAEGLTKGTLTAEGGLLTDATAHMQADMVMLRDLSAQGGSNKKLADKLMKGELSSVEALSQADRQALKITEIDLTKVTSGQSEISQIIKNKGGIEAGLKDAEAQLEKLLTARYNNTAQQAKIKSLQDAIAGVTSHYAPNSPATSNFNKLVTDLNTARDKAYKLSDQARGVTTIQQAGPEVAKGTPMWKQLAAAAGLTTGAVALSKGGKGTVTKARDKARSTVTASWGLSPLQAPVVYRKKLASALAAPTLKSKNMEFKLPKVDDVQVGGSPLTATPGSTNKAVRQLSSSNMLSAPVGY